MSTKHNLDHDEFPVVFASFTGYIKLLKERMPEIKWTRDSEEVYGHGRIREFGVWYEDGKGLEYGHIFMAKSFTWDGLADYERIKEILSDHKLAIGPDDQSKVWDLSQLAEQTEPVARCAVCGETTSRSPYTSR